MIGKSSNQFIQYIGNPNIGKIGQRQMYFVYTGIRADAYREHSPGESCAGLR
jgi:hypothetical protein